MAELTINTADITAAIKKNLEGFAPDVELTQVGRVIEVGDGIARVAGLPDAAVNELLEFESGLFGLALNLDEDSIGAVVLGEVDSIDGFVIAFSPWAIENLRFDETIGGKLHGYDFDISMQVKEAGKKIVTEDLRVIHHHSLELISEMEGWVDTHMQLSRKWQHLLPDNGGGEPDWEERARRAEAELSATRLMAGAGEIIWEARTQELERELNEVKNSTSWKITRPLRRLRGSKEKNS